MSESGMPLEETDLAAPEGDGEEEDENRFLNLLTKLRFGFRRLRTARSTIKNNN